MHNQVCAAFFQENQQLLEWVNHQPLSDPVTCLGDGHPGVWNLIAEIATPQQRREVLDWIIFRKIFTKWVALTSVYRLLKAVFGVVKLMKPLLPLVIGILLKSKTFWFILTNIDHGSNYQELQFHGITIGYGSVESTIKQIGRRIKISGAQWNRQNLPQVLKHRCAYLNFEFNYMFFSLLIH